MRQCVWVEFQVDIWYKINTLMAIRLEKGQRINLEKESGTKLTNFCVGCNWGAIIEKKFFGLLTHVVDVDLDLSCMMFDAAGNVVDHIWSPLYNFRGKLPQGKLDSNDHALHHTGDDRTGDQNGDDGLDNEIITVDLNRVNPNVNSIVFFLNIYNNSEYSGDSPLGNAVAEDCANYCVMMFSDFTRKVTMQNLFHDGGFSSMGMSLRAMNQYAKDITPYEDENGKVIYG